MFGGADMPVDLQAALIAALNRATTITVNLNVTVTAAPAPVGVSGTAVPPSPAAPPNIFGITLHTSPIG